MKSLYLSMIEFDNQRLARAIEHRSESINIRFVSYWNSEVARIIDRINQTKAKLEEVTS